MMLPPVFTIMLTGKCLYNCPFCFGPGKDVIEMNVKTWRAIFSFLRRQSVRAVLIGGGEPLLYSGVEEIIKLVRSSGFLTSISTACPSRESAIRVAILSDWVELCLLGSCSEIHGAVGRVSDNFNTVIDVLSYLSGLKKPRIKINTVVTPNNAPDLIFLARLLSRYRIDTWKVLEVRSRGMALSHLGGVMYRFQEHEDLLDELRSVVSSVMPNVRVVFSPAQDGDGAYVIVDPDGRVLIPHGDNYEQVGDISKIHSWSCEQEREFVRIVGENVDVGALTREFETSFEAIGRHL